MTTTRTVFRTYLTPLIEGRSVISATTSAAGATAKTTMVASSLIEYYDDFGQGGFFNGWYAYQTAASEERRVKEFVAETGTLSFYRAFTSVAQSLAFELHPYPVADYNTCINLALKDMYSEGLYFNPIYNETLWGQNEYGTGDNEFNKVTYTVPSTFQEFPKAIYIRESYQGTHTGSDNAATLTDSTKSWKTSELVGEIVYNKTDGSVATITANTSTTVTATLAGGTGDDWDEDDEYVIPRPDKRLIPFRDYTRTGFAKTGAFEFQARIPESYVVVLEGHGPLSAYTTDAGTTELAETDARVVALWAAYRFCEMMSQRNGGDREIWNQKAQEWWQKFQNQKHGGLEKPLPLRKDLSWL